MRACGYDAIHEFCKYPNINTIANTFRMHISPMNTTYNPSALQIMLKNDMVDVNLKNKHGQTALMYASETGHASIPFLLASDKIDVNCIDNMGNNALFYALDDEDILEDLMKHPKINVGVRDLRMYSCDKFSCHAKAANMFHIGTKKLVNIQNEIASHVVDLNTLEFKRTFITKQKNKKEKEIRLLHIKNISDLREKEKLLLIDSFDVNVYDVSNGKTCIALYVNDLCYDDDIMILPGIDVYKYDYNLTYMHELIVNKDTRTFKRALLRSIPPEPRHLKTMLCPNNEMSKLWINIDTQPRCYSNPYHNTQKEEMTGHPYLRIDNYYNIILPLKKHASRLMNVLFDIEKIPHTFSNDMFMYRLVY